jgi:hypothetical protein
VAEYLLALGIGCWVWGIGYLSGRFGMRNMISGRSSNARRAPHYQAAIFLGGAFLCGAVASGTSLPGAAVLWFAGGVMVLFTIAVLRKKSDLAA